MSAKLDHVEINETSPEQLLVVFSRGRILFWMAIAVLIHVVVIGSTSLNYIQDRWIDPEGARIRKEAAAAALDAEKKAKAAAKAALRAAATNAPGIRASATNVPVAAVTGGVPVSVTATSAPAASAAVDEAAQLASRSNSAVIKRITATASSNELPRASELGISIEDTNPQH